MAGHESKDARRVTVGGLWPPVGLKTFFSITSNMHSFHSNGFRDEGLGFGLSEIGHGVAIGGGNCPRTSPWLTTV